MQKEEEGNIMHFWIGPLCIVLAIWSNWTKIKQNKEAQQERTRLDWMVFQQSLSYNL